MVLPPAEIAHGPMFIGTVFNILLYGVTIAQLYLYYTQSSKRDSLWIQCFVYFLFLADTAQMVFTVIYMYDSLIKHFGDVEYLTTANWVFATDPALTGMIGGFVQGFFAWRVKLLTKNIFIALILLLCAALSFFMGIGTAVAIGMIPEFAQFQKFQVIVIIWLVAASFADILITYSLVTYLRKHRSSFSQTDTRVDRISRCLLTAVWAFVDMMVYLLDPTGLHLLFNFPLSKLYTNSLMSSLNARSFWQYNTHDDAIVNSHRTTFQLSNLRSGGDVTTKHRDAEVFVEVQSHRVIDPPEKIDLDDCLEDQNSGSRTAISAV